MTTTMKRLLPTVVFALASASGVAWAQQTAAGSTGLGQSWPNATDVSSSPNWHVYVFIRDGIRYIQVNDLNGNVRAAFAAANGTALVLPIGSGVQLVVTPQQPGATAPSGETVYRDNSVQVLSTPQSNGNVRMNALMSTCGNPEDCNLIVK